MTTFEQLLEEAKILHKRKSHDYASDENPYGNYHFAGMLSKLFNNPNDAGFVGRLGEKLYRLANLENNQNTPQNESISDTELDIVVITILWMASRKDGRIGEQLDTDREEVFDKYPCGKCGVNPVVTEGTWCVFCATAE